MYENLEPGTSIAEDIYDHTERGRYEESRYFKLILGEIDQDFLNHLFKTRVDQRKNDVVKISRTN